MDPLVALCAAGAGYFLGSLSFARLISKLVAPDQDLTTLKVPIVGTDETSKVNIFGANAASMILGPRFGCAIGLLDMLKVALPMQVFKSCYPHQVYFLIVAVAGLVGHNWPVYHRFKGGRGFSVIFGGFVVVDWLGALVTLVVGMLLGMIVLQNVSVAYVAWLWLMIPWMWFRTHDFSYLSYAAAVNLIFFIATLPETRMIIQYRREGKLDGYMQGLMESSPRWRGMQKIAERFNVFRMRPHKAENQDSNSLS
jgi:glycerol-3-phosphate acyltransferase PlsY